MQVAQLLQVGLPVRSRDLLEARTSRHVLELLPLCPVARNPDPALGKLQRLGPHDRPLLHEAAIRDDEQDGSDEGENPDSLRPAAPDCDCNCPAGPRADEPDPDGEPHRHRIRSRDRESRQAAGDETEQHDHDD